MKPESHANRESAAQRITTGLVKIGMAVKSRNWSEAGKHGLTPTQAQILSFLNGTAQQSASLGEIAEGMAITPPTASDSVSSLVGKGLVTKQRSAADGRAVTLALTGEGRHLAQEVSDWTDFLASTVEALAPDEQEVFVKGLVKIIRTLQVRGEIPLSRMCVTCRYFRPNIHAGSTAPHHCDYVDMRFGDAALKIHCSDHELAPDEMQRALWSRFQAANDTKSLG